MRVKLERGLSNWVITIKGYITDGALKVNIKPYSPNFNSLWRRSVLRLPLPSTEGRVLPVLPPGGANLLILGIIHGSNTISIILGWKTGTLCHGLEGKYTVPDNSIT